MALGRLLLAWLRVGALFAVTPPIGYHWTGDVAGVRAFVWSHNRWEIWWRLAEAGVVTRFASVWFDSLGAGGWWLLFFLIGLLVAFPRRLVMWQHVEAQRRRHLLAHAGPGLAPDAAGGGLRAPTLP